MRLSQLILSLEEKEMCCAPETLLLFLVIDSVFSVPIISYKSISQWLRWCIIHTCMNKNNK